MLEQYFTSLCFQVNFSDFMCFSFRNCSMNDGYFIAGVFGLDGMGQLESGRMRVHREDLLQPKCRFGSYQGEQKCHRSDVSWRDHLPPGDPASHYCKPLPPCDCHQFFVEFGFTASSCAPVSTMARMCTNGKQI